MNETNDSTNETKSSAKKTLRPGSLFVICGILFCTLGGTRLATGIFNPDSGRNTYQLVSGGLFLAAGIINLAVGLARKKATAKGCEKISNDPMISSGPVLLRALGFGLTMGGGAILGISLCRQFLAEQGQLIYGWMIVGAVAFVIGLVLIRSQRLRGGNTSD